MRRIRWAPASTSSVLPAIDGFSSTNRTACDSEPLVDAGAKDITAHVNFSAIALAGQDAGLDVLGYTSQAHFLLNSGLADAMAGADAPARAAAHQLVAEHEMGELFKVIGFAKNCRFDPVGFAAGDRSHRL